MQCKSTVAPLLYGGESIPFLSMSWVGYDSFDDPARTKRNSHKFSIAVSQVNQRFRRVALQTPRIWTRLSSWMTTSELETFVYRSKAADLVITVTTEEYELSYVDLEAFLAITLPHRTRWSEFTYDAVANTYPFSQAIFSQTRHLSFPRLRSLRFEKGSCTDSDANGVLPEDTFSTWDMPALTHFEGFNPSFAGGGIAKNAKSVQLHMDDSYPMWDYHFMFHGLRSWPHLTSLIIDMAYFGSSFEPSKMSFWSLRALVIDACVGDGLRLGRVFALLDMPVLASMSLGIGDTVERVDDLIEGMCSALTRSLCLREVTLDTTGIDQDHCYRFGVLGMFLSKLPYLEKVTFRGAALYDSPRYLELPQWQLFHFEEAAPEDMLDINAFVAFVASRNPNFKLRMTKCAGQCKEIRALNKLLGDRLEYQANVK